MNFAKSASLMLAGTCFLLLNGCYNSSPNASPVAINTQPLNSAYYTSGTNGPRYSVISVQNPNSNSSATINALSLQGNSFQIINRTSQTNDVNYGNDAQCATSANPALNQVNTLANGAQCIIVLEGAASSPANAPSIGTLSITTRATGAVNNVTSTTTQTFNLKNTTYLYVAGNFHNLGSASAGSDYLLAACNDGTCQNYLANGGGADQNFSAGLGLATDSLGNLYLGGAFHTLGSATAGNHYLLAKCAAGICQNYFNDSTTEGADNVINDLAVDDNGNLYVGGNFQNLGSASTTANYLLAKCSQGGCQNYFGPGSTAGAIQNITASGFTLVSIKNGNLYVSGSFNNLNGITSNNNYVFAQCSIGNNPGTCQNYFLTSNNGLNGRIQTIEADSSGNLYPAGEASTIGPVNLPSIIFPQCANGSCINYLQGTTQGANAHILSITKDANGNFYLGGIFTQLGTVNTTPNTDLLLVKCSQGSCQNYFSDNGGASGLTDPPWEGINDLITDANGNLYIGGRFTTLDNLSTVNGTNLLAVCSTSGAGACRNFLNDGSGSDGSLGDFSINNQITVTPQQ